MTFRFKIEKSWENDRIGVYHLIGLLNEGSILPNSKGVIEESPHTEVYIQSVSLVTYPDGKPHPDEFTLSIDKPNFKLKDIEGMTLKSIVAA